MPCHCFVQIILVRSDFCRCWQSSSATCFPMLRRPHSFFSYNKEAGKKNTVKGEGKKLLCGRWVPAKTPSGRFGTDDIRSLQTPLVVRCAKDGPQTQVSVFHNNDSDCVSITLPPLRTVPRPRPRGDNRNTPPGSGRRAWVSGSAGSIRR